MNKKCIKLLSVLAPIGVLFSVYAYSLGATAQVNVAATTAPINSPDLSAENVSSKASKAKLRTALGQFDSLKTSFTQTIVDLQGEVLQSASGELRLKKPQKLRWTILVPDESVTIANGTTVYNVDPFLEQVTILDQAPLTRSNPLMLLISDEAAQWDKVSVSEHTPKNNKIVNGTAYTIISLAPNALIEKVELRFDAQNTLVSLVSYDRQQQQNLLTFSNVELNTGVSDQDFIFTPNDSFIVDDQRESSNTQ